VKHLSVDAFGIDDEARARLERFAGALQRWNGRINLVAPGDEPQLWQRHILDSAQLVPLLPGRTGTLIDLGSGAGFPGLIIAILTSWHVQLVEADHRKAAFLREVARATGTHVTIHAIRSEALQTMPADVVTARAYAPLVSLIPVAERLVARGGVCLFPKGRGAKDELTAAAREWHMRVERFPSRTSPDATLLRISEIRRAGLL
jgi:16S rRNA (guanine(527)-N(7))-methyltransferase RsmG